MLVVDSSVAAKWFLREPGTEEAEGLLAGSAPLVAPDLVLAEVANALWKNARRGGAERFAPALRRLPGLFARLFPMTGLEQDAFDLALRRNHPVYDCFYVALARRERAPLVTADARLAERFHMDAELRILS